MYFGLNSTSLAEYFFSRLDCDKVCLPMEGGGLGIRKVGFAWQVVMAIWEGS